MTPDPPGAGVALAWAEPTPEIGEAVYRLTHGPGECVHYYHTQTPFSPDDRRLLFFRRQAGLEVGEVCVMDLASGAVRVVGTSAAWCDHTAAGQQWQGDRPRILYHERSGRGYQLAAVDPDGANRRVYAHDRFFHCTSPDGRFSFGRSTLLQCWPDDTIAPRGDVGVFRLDHDTGRLDLRVSLEQALARHPMREEIAHCHLMLVQIVPHPEADRILFCMHNHAFCSGAGEAPFVKSLNTADGDGSRVRYLGEYGHHPVWRPGEDQVLCNMPRRPKGWAFGLFRGDGVGPVEFIAAPEGDGHPSFRPGDGRLLTDRGVKRDREPWVRVVLCDPASGLEITLAEYPHPQHTKSYTAAIEARPTGKSLAEALTEAQTCHPPWVTHAHPVWSRDSRFVVFNGDATGGSQLYLVDVEAALSAHGAPARAETERP